MERRPSKKNSKSNDEFPISSPSKIIITSNETYSFDKGTYIEAYLRHCITQKEYDSIITDASRIMGQSWSKKRLNDQIKMPQGVIILAIIATILALIYMILIYYSVSSDNGNVLIITAIVSVSLGSAIVFSLSIYNFCRKIGKFISLEEIIQSDLKEYFFKVNSKFGPNLNFSFNLKKRWIECNIQKPSEKGTSEERRTFMGNEGEDEDIQPKYDNIRTTEKNLNTPRANNKYKESKHSKGGSMVELKQYN